MNNPLALEELRCGASDQNHVVIDPVKLDDCEHSICKKCVSKNYNDQFECKICGEFFKQDLRTCEISEEIKQIGNDYLDIFKAFKALEVEKIMDLKETQIQMQKESSYYFENDGNNLDIKLISPHQNIILGSPPNNFIHSPIHLSNEEHSP